jgi:mono/diheme cytochrome c family protein
VSKHYNRNKASWNRNNLVARRRNDRAARRAPLLFRLGIPSGVKEIIMRQMPIRQRAGVHLALVLAALLCAGTTARAQQASPAQLARGKYLVEFGGCNDCHTPGYFLGKPDMSRYLSGSDAGLEIPDAGVFVAPNLTPDKQTGLGDWSRDQIVAALQTGVRPDGRVLSPIMPWPAFAKLTKADAGAIADYLLSLPPGQQQGAGTIWSEREAANPSHGPAPTGRRRQARTVVARDRSRRAGIGKGERRVGRGPIVGISEPQWIPLRAKTSRELVYGPR